MTARINFFLAVAVVASASAGAQSDDRYRDDRTRGDRGDDIQLVCYGGAEKLTSEVHNGFEWDDQRHKYVPKQSVETGKAQFQATLNVSIHDDRGQIQIPKSLIPPIHSGGSDGWWNLDDLIVGHNEIRARFRLNGMNQPRVTINRRTGAIDIDGLVKFSGRCDADEGHRRF